MKIILHPKFERKRVTTDRRQYILFYLFYFFPFFFIYFFYLFFLFYFHFCVLVRTSGHMTIM